ncbi:MAG TPA: hypothetical protein VGL56_13265 [Fimbriimonadaceae bacterium]|jgi:hypothetical protein
MNIKSKRGRTTVAALSLVLVACIATAIGLVRRASAQSVQPAMTYNFGPIQGITTGGSTQTLIGLLLPAVRTGSPFVLEIFNQDTVKELQINTVGAPPRTNARFMVTITQPATGAAGYKMTITNVATNQSVVLNTAFSDFTARLVPAVQDNNMPVSPLSASATITGLMGDGSVRFQYGSPVLLLPAV